MSVTCCHVRSDLSLLRPIGEGAGEPWSAPALPPEESTSPRAYAERARKAAAWAAAQPHLKRRLGVIVVDVDESLCFMVRAPSLARPVLAASVRQSSQDWGDWAPAAGIEPLADLQTTAPKLKLPGAKPAPGAAIPAEGLTVPVYTQTDSVIRLWLDALDAVGVESDAVISLWHALALAWGESAEPTLVVLAEPRRWVWAWAKGSGLLCAGSVGLDERRPPAEPATEPAGVDASSATEPPSVDPLVGAARRAALDWMSWAGQMGFAPEQAVIVGEHPEQVAQALKTAWNGRDPTLVTSNDPVARAGNLATERLQKKRGTTSGPRFALTRLTNRPARSVRTKYLLRAVALGLVGLGLLGLGSRLSQASADAGEGSEKMAKEIQEKVEAAVPDLDIIEGRRLSKLLADKVAEMEKVKPFEAPAAPPAIHDELARIVDIFAKQEGVKIQRLSLGPTAQDCTVTVTTPADRKIGESIFESLKAPDAKMTWSQRREGPASTTLTFMGVWKPQ